MRLPFNRWPPRGDASPAADSAYGCKATRATKPVVLGTPPKEAAALPALPSVTLVAGLLATALRAELGRPMDRRDRWPPPSLSMGVSRDAKTPALALAAPNGSCGVGCMGDASTGDATDSPDAELSDRMRDLGGETHAGSTCVSDRDGSCGGDTLCSRSSEPGGGSCLRGVPRCSGRAGDGGGDRREGASWNFAAAGDTIGDGNGENGLLFVGRRFGVRDPTEAVAPSPPTPWQLLGSVHRGPVPAMPRGGTTGRLGDGGTPAPAPTESREVAPPRPAEAGVPCPKSVRAVVGPPERCCPRFRGVLGGDRGGVRTRCRLFIVPVLSWRCTRNVGVRGEAGRIGSALQKKMRNTAGHRRGGFKPPPGQTAGGAATYARPAPSGCTGVEGEA